MVWTQHPENSLHPNKCSVNAPKWDPKYMICMKTELPRTDTVQFMVNMDHFSVPNMVPNWNKPSFSLENPWAGAESYISPCDGDSGSGQFTTNQDTQGLLYNNDFDGHKISIDESFKMILTGILSIVYLDDGIKDKKGKVIRDPVPCGTNLYSIKENKYFQSIGVTHAVGSPEVHQWITHKYTTF